jgi:hypothetical protein
MMDLFKSNLQFFSLAIMTLGAEAAAAQWKSDEKINEKQKDPRFAPKPSPGNPFKKKERKTTAFDVAFSTKATERRTKTPPRSEPPIPFRPRAASTTSRSK